MKFSARTIANRRNARRSTGPKSAAGKAKAAQNALQHGLAIPVELDMALAPEIERLAIAIAGENPNALRHAAARRVAEAQVDLMRIRDARVALLENPRERVKPPRFSDVCRAISALLRIENASMRRAKKGRNSLRNEDRATLEEDLVHDSDAGAALAPVDERPGGGKRELSLVEGFDELAPKIAKLDRYERRARSRRKRAMREFDALSKPDESGGLSGVRASSHAEGKSDDGQNFGTLAQASKR